MPQIEILTPEVISRNRQFFIKSEKLITKEIQNQMPQIHESWVRSQAYGVNPRQTILPYPIKKLLSKPDKYRSNINNQIICHMKKIASNSKIAMLVLDEQLNVFLMDGNELLLKSLHSKNICVGASFAEQLIGTNAAALTLYSKNDSCVMGAEHYVEALQNYVTCATICQKEKGILNYVMLIAANDDFHPSMPGLLYYHQISHSLNFALEQKKLECSMAEKFIKEISKEELLFCDQRGVILYISDWLTNVVGLTKENIIGYQLDAIFPELIDVFRATKDKEIPCVTEIYFKNCPNKKEFLVKVQSISRNDYAAKAIIFIFMEKRIRNNAHITGFKAQYTFADLIGSSREFQETIAIAERVAKGCSNVLIEGETGTGKELFAQAIHNASRRKDGPFISINCAAIPRELIGSELFGYVEGAFTGARKGGTAGKFEIAHMGTIFLDEIGEMPLDMQAVLLRVLEEKKVTRLGGSGSISVDVRIIAATNKNIQASANNGEFRMDLYYRLSVINIEIPSLKKRREDVPLLADHFLKQYSYNFGRYGMSFTPEVQSLFTNYCWPGNIRELRNVVESIVNLCTSAVIRIEDLPKKLIEKCTDSLQHLEQGYDYYEKELVWDLMKEYNGNKSGVAKKLGISRPALYNKLKKYKI